MDNLQENMTYKLTVHKYEGVLKCVYLNHYRVAGGKPLGGNSVVGEWDVTLKHLIQAIPEIRNMQARIKELEAALQSKDKEEDLCEQLAKGDL